MEVYRSRGRLPGQFIGLPSHWLGAIHLANASVRRVFPAIGYFSVSRFENLPSYRSLCAKWQALADYWQRPRNRGTMKRWRVVAALTWLPAVCAQSDAVKIEIFSLAPSVIQSRLELVTQKMIDRRSTLESLFREAGCDAEYLTEKSIPHLKDPNLVCVLPENSHIGDDCGWRALRPGEERHGFRSMIWSEKLQRDAAERL